MNNTNLTPTTSSFPPQPSSMQAPVFLLTTTSVWTPGGPDLNPIPLGFCSALMDHLIAKNINFYILINSLQFFQVNPILWELTNQFVIS